MALTNSDALALCNQGERGQNRAFANLFRSILTTGLKGVSAQTAGFTPYNLSELRLAAALKDPLPDTPNGTSLGLADAAGSLVVGTTTNSGATATATETCAFQMPIPRAYIDGAAFKVRVRAKLSTLTGHTGTVAVTCKLVNDAGISADLVTTSAQALTAAYADYDFVVTPTTLTGGALVVVQVTLASTATAASNANPSISAVGLVPTIAA